MHLYLVYLLLSLLCAWFFLTNLVKQIFAHKIDNVYRTTTTNYGDHMLKGQQGQTSSWEEPRKMANATIPPDNLDAVLFSDSFKPRSSYSSLKRWDSLVQFTMLLPLGLNNPVERGSRSGGGKDQSQVSQTRNAQLSNHTETKVQARWQQGWGALLQKEYEVPWNNKLFK